MLKRYPLAYNPILEYWEKIQNGIEVVSKKVQRTYQKVVYDLENQNKYIYSNKKANHVIEFFENFIQPTKGKFAKENIKLDLWEKALLATTFGFVDKNGNRKYTEVRLIVAKKNGKSLIASGIGLYMLMADGEPGAEVYSVATKVDQAKIIWNEAKNIIKKNKVLVERLKTLVSTIEYKKTFSIFKPLASDKDKLDGFNVHCGLMDEIHQWKNGKALYDIIKDGTINREQPLIFITSTAGTIREDIYDYIYEDSVKIIDGYFNEDGYKDERTIAFIYELDSKDEWENPHAWKKSNPGLGTIRKVDSIENEVNKAKQDKSKLKNLLCKVFNIRETSSESWLSYEEANNTETFNLKTIGGRYGIGGVDLSKSGDLTCASVLFQVRDDATKYLMQMYFLPEDLLELKEKEDKVPYSKWVEQGLMRLTPGNRVDYQAVTQWFLEVQNEHDIYLYKVGYDSWSAAYFVKEMEETFGKIMVKVDQTFKRLTHSMENLRIDLIDKKINYNNNPILKWNLKNTTVVYDQNNNMKPQKPRDRTKKIDGLASLLDAYVVYEDILEEYQNLI